MLRSVRLQSPVNVTVVQHDREEIHIVCESDGCQNPEDRVSVDPRGRLQLLLLILIRTSSCTTSTQHHQTHCICTNTDTNTTRHAQSRAEFDTHSDEGIQCMFLTLFVFFFFVYLKSPPHVHKLTELRHDARWRHIQAAADPWRARFKWVADGRDPIRFGLVSLLALGHRIWTELRTVVLLAVLISDIQHTTYKTSSVIFRF